MAFPFIYEFMDSVYGQSDFDSASYSHRTL